MSYTFAHFSLFSNNSLVCAGFRLPSRWSCFSGLRVPSVAPVGVERRSPWGKTHTQSHESSSANARIRSELKPQQRTVQRLQICPSQTGTKHCQHFYYLFTLVSYSQQDYCLSSDSPAVYLNVAMRLALCVLVTTVPSWQEAPIQLWAQRQQPLRWSHCAPFSHSQASAQSGP